MTADRAELVKWLDRDQPVLVISEASAVLPGWKELGRKIPRDLALVGVFLADFSGATAGVRQNHRSAGGVAVAIRAGQLQPNKFGVLEIPTTTLVEGTWFEGAACPAVKQA